MTAPPTAVVIDGAMKDFTTGRKPIRFTVDDDVFEGPAEIAAEALIAYGERFADNQTDTGKTQLDDLKALMEILLWEDDFKRLCERLGDRRNPIGLKQLDDIASWLTEHHGMRPTQPPSDSSSASSNPASGIDSTEIVQLEGSIPVVSPSPDS